MKTPPVSAMETKPGKRIIGGLSKTIAVVKQKAAGVFILLCFLLNGFSANAQSFIRFGFTLERVTVPIGPGSTNSTVITNSVNLSGGATNANFDVSGLFAGVGAVLTDTNLNSLLSTEQDTNLLLTLNTTNIPEGIYTFRLNAGGFDTNGLPVTNSVIFVLQAAHIWNGSLNVSNGWSDAGSWLGGVPSSSSDVVFGDQGAQTNIFSGSSFTNSFVDVDTTIASLRFSQTGVTNSIATGLPSPVYHHIQIFPAKALTISGTNGFSLMRDYCDDAAAGLNSMNVTIDGGAGSKMIVSNQNANVSIFAGGSLVPTLNMSNLDIFIAKVGRVGIADYQIYPYYRDLNTGLNAGRGTNNYSARPRQMSANFYLAKTNFITAAFKDVNNYTNELTRGYPFSFLNNEQSGVGSGTSQILQLGISNIFLLDAVCFFNANGNGTVRFGPTNAVAVFRGTNGTSRMSVFTISDDGGTNEAASNLKGIVDFSLGTVDALVDRLYLSRDRELIQTNQTPNVQSDLIVGKGTFDVNTAVLGYQEHTKPDWTVIGGGQPYLNYCQGRLVVTSNGTFRVNGTLTLGYTADTNNPGDASQFGTYGQITINSNSTLTASNIVVDGGLNFYDPGQSLGGSTPRVNTITINQGGNLIVSNSIGANNYTGSLYPTFANAGLPGLPVDTFTMGQSSILTMFVTGKTNVFVRNFVSTGTTPGTIKIASLPVGLGFPTNIPLIHYQTATPVVAADMSAVAASYPGVQGYILNDSVGKNINLFLTTNAPNTLTWTGGQNNNWDLSSLNWVITGGSVVTNFSMGDIANFDDSSSVTNVNISEVVVPNQATNGVVITNSARIYTFNAAGGAIAGTAKILKLGTNSVKFNASEAGPIAVTAGEVDVLSSGILGNTTLSSNTVLKVNSGGSVAAGLSSTASTVTVANGGSISGGGISLIGGSLVNNGTISVPTGSALVQTNNAVFTNTINGVMNFGNSNPAWDSYPGTTVANFGFIYVTQGRVIPRGLWFGNGTIYDPVTSAPQGSTLARFNLKADPNAVLSIGATPGSIDNMFVQGRFDLSDAANNNNAGGRFLVDVDIGNHVNDTVTATRWNNLGGCYWIMNNINGNFSSGQTFNVLVNANGLGVSNFVDTITLYPTVLPTVPGPGLQWNLTGLQNYGTIGVTNSTMVWNGGGTGNWNTNGDTGVWKSGRVYGDNQGAVFDDSASASTPVTVTLTTPVAPAGFNTMTVTNIVGVTTNVVTTISMPSFMPGIVVSNDTKNYTFVSNTQTNRITGMVGIYKTGPGTLTVLTSNDFSGGLTIDGGTFAMTNTTALGPNVNQIYNQVMMDNNATVKFFGTTNQNLGHFITINQNGGTFEVSSSANTLMLDKAILGTGGLTKTGPGTLILSQTGDIYPGGTTVNAGTLRLIAAAAGFGGVTLANNSALEVTNGVGGTALGITLTNAINITGAGTAINILGVSTNIFTGPWSGAGTVTITATNNADLTVFNGDLSGFGGTISFGTSSNAFRFNNRTNDNPCTGSAGATFNLGTGSASLYNYNGSNIVYNLGALAGGANTVLYGRFTNSAEPAGTIYSIGAANVPSTTFAGKITNGLDTVTIVKVGTGALLLNGVSTYTGTTTVSNGVLGGTGSIASALTVTANGTLSPGASVGTFTVSNNVTLAGSVLMELNQADPKTNDLLVVTGTLTGGGNLVVTNIGPNIINGSKFTLFSKLVTGFASVTLPNTPAYNWQNDLGVNGSITLISGGSVNTNAFKVTTSFDGVNLTLSWPLDHTGYHVQAQTNSLEIGLSNNWVTIDAEFTPAANTTNKVVIPVVLGNPSVFYRLIYP